MLKVSRLVRALNTDAGSSTPIGYVKSPYTSGEDMPRYYTDSGDITATLEILPEYREALLGVKPGMKLLMLFHFHEATEHSLLQEVMFLHRVLEDNSYTPPKDLLALTKKIKRRIITAIATSHDWTGGYCR